MTHRLRWTEPAVGQLGAIAEYISLSSPIYAEQVVERVVLRLWRSCMAGRICYPTFDSTIA